MKVISFRYFKVSRFLMENDKNKTKMYVRVLM